MSPVSRARSADERILRRAAWRIGLQTACAVAVVSVGLAAAAVLVVLGAQHRNDGDLIQTAIETADDVTDPPAGMWLVIRRHGVEMATPGLPDGLPDQRQIDEVAADRVSRSADLRVRHRDYRVQTEAEPDGRVVQVLLDLSPDHAVRFGLVEAFAVTGLVGLLLAATAGVWLGRRAVAPLAEALTLQRRFVADAGQELRTPLTLLRTRAQLLRRALREDAATAVPASVTAEVDSLIADSGHLTEILDDLLLAADPRQLGTDEVVRLPALVAEVAEATRPTAEECGVTVTVETAGAPPPVIGARASLRSAVTALLDHAIRHADGQVWVTVGVEGRDVVIDVADDGPGIAPDIVATMFDRFSDADRNARHRYGFGLALVNEVAANHGGWISVVYTGRAGATLRLRLPAVRALG